jgi:hypothetical protein
MLVFSIWPSRKLRHDQQDADFSCQQLHAAAMTVSQLSHWQMATEMALPMDSYFSSSFFLFLKILSLFF